MSRGMHHEVNAILHCLDQLKNLTDLRTMQIFFTHFNVVRAWSLGEKNLKVRSGYNVLNFPALFSVPAVE